MFPVPQCRCFVANSTGQQRLTALGELSDREKPVSGQRQNYGPGECPEEVLSKSRGRHFERMANARLTNKRMMAVRETWKDLLGGPDRQDDQTGLRPGASFTRVDYWGTRPRMRIAHKAASSVQSQNMNQNKCRQSSSQVDRAVGRQERSGTGNTVESDTAHELIQFMVSGPLINGRVASSDWRVRRSSGLHRV